MTQQALLKAAIIGVAAFAIAEFVRGTDFYANAGTDTMKQFYLYGGAAVGAGVALYLWK